MEFPSLRGTFRSLSALLAAVGTLPRKQKTLLIGIDGCGGSGKSTCARLLGEARPDVTVVHMDDFYRPAAERGAGTAQTKPVGADFDWPRLLREVLEPLRQNQPGRYQRYDWPTDQLSEAWQTVPVGGIVVVEGVSATRKELRALYDFRIWVECPYELRLARGLARDGEEARDRWVNDWMVAEGRYAEAHRPMDHADLVIDGSR